MGPQSGQRGALLQAAVRGAGLGRLGGAGAGLGTLGGAGSSAAPTAVTMTRVSVTLVSMLWLLPLVPVTGDHVWTLRSRFRQFHQPGVPGLAAPRAADTQDTLSATTARKNGKQENNLENEYLQS